MINKERIVEEFTQLASIDSISLFERNMADALTKKLTELGFTVKEDGTGAKIGGTAGNLIGKLPGNTNAPAVLFAAHMDTVNPGKGKKPIIEDDIIRTDGTTILGSDDLSGIVPFLESIRSAKEQGIKHGDVYAIFTVAEEIGLLGSSNLDFSGINAKYGFVLDSGGDIGKAIVKAPFAGRLDFIVHGKASHAGVAPEKGISAIQIAAQAISEMRLGKIDEETTANIGIIEGGKATNIICDKVIVKGEARSLNEEKYVKQIEHMCECFDWAGKMFGGSVEFEMKDPYKGFNIEKPSKIISVFEEAAKASGLCSSLEVSCGGSDANVFNQNGICTINLSTGMQNVHSVEEKVKISDMISLAGLLTQILRIIGMDLH